MSADHEYMDTGALTPDAVPEPAPDQSSSWRSSYQEPAPVQQPPVEAPDSPAAQQDEQLDAPSATQGRSLPPGAYVS